ALALGQHAHQRLEGGGLARPVAAHQGHDLAAAHFEVHVVQDLRCAIPGLQAAGAQQCVLGFRCHVHAVSAAAAAAGCLFFSKVFPVPKYTSCTLGWSRSSSGLPSAIRRPRASTIIRSAYAKTTSMLCSVNSTAMPRSVTN